ncbi:thiosulfohydrolase SoxB [Sulfurimonas autotrophica]|uniref:Sulfate thiol esterase SoxB n=1 Tax=Sulfurimonas autotrophica (strain ATCC BAA-671 / DSM 16294 / JCM 11897 / OK10) TaxID=563040 RepID=E0US21_SULAO|nr:thiosulfohydrolase SoxB [Sulfurimonas autotrophica]ADN09044.1 sulfate thiol esterase SoxB [Sulfurimonas autotrophica DSM 16294]
MEISRRDFMHIAAIFGLTAATSSFASSQKIEQIGLKDIYQFNSMGNFTLMHICDLHAHVKPLYWREPSTLISAPNLVGTPGFLCGEAFAKHYGLEPSSLDAYFDTYIDFSKLAKKFGKMGGIAHIKTLTNHIIKERGKENVLFLDSGDTWQGTGVALKTGGEAIVKAQNYLGIDTMVGHWEFTYGKERVKELIDMLDAKFISQNIVGDDPFADEYEELIFEPYTIEERGGAKIGIIGQSFPFTSTANPKEFTEGWSFGLRLETLQEYVDELKNEKKVDCVVVLSHDGFSVDQEVARKVKGIDFILSGHTHDPSPEPIVINDTVIVIAGSHGKYIGRLDIDAKDGKVNGYEYKLIPIASNIIPADPEGVKLVNKLYAPFDKEFNEVLGQTKGMLYKRDTFFSTFDQLINDAIIDEMKCDISFTPGYRWGTTVLAGDNILMDNVYEMCGITYPDVYTFELKGEKIATLLEDIADNVFNANPLYQQGGDMSRLGGVTYSIAVANKAGKRISNLKIGGKPIDLKKTYVVSSWGGNLQKAGANLQTDKIRPVYDVVRDYIKREKVVDVSNKGNVTLVDYSCGCPTKGSRGC